MKEKTRKGAQNIKGKKENIIFKIWGKKQKTLLDNNTKKKRYRK